MSNEVKDMWPSNHSSPTSIGEYSDMESKSNEEGQSNKKPSASYDIIQITPVERFNCVYKSGQKTRVTCWVLLRHRLTSEVVITGAISIAGSGGKMTLAIDLPDVEKFSAM